ncbi:PorT family protein [Seonamhaeicola algicola]|uniref:PorT family protein n=2 Tax=Seonamhaeicola TaxID=1649495 RepID=A0A5C7B4A9_9FLAO|nr:porin family protein [Seonamhaeicola algicola]TXE12712.1 PorT family protein [Seonamhaeicola algicola]
MKFFIAIIFILGFSSQNVAQNIKEQKQVVDSLYKEDQFYAGVTYNLLANKPKNMNQNGFSLGFHIGYIKDIPINKRRNIALALGLGYSSNSYNQNLLISEQSSTTNYSILNDNSFSKNKFSNHLIEIPFEFRWRTSTPTDYNFWRIYTGFKVGYIFSNSVKYKGELGDFKLKSVDDFNKFQYGLTLSVGYNTWNLHVYYALNNMLNDNATLNNATIDMNAVKIGLMFYFL